MATLPACSEGVHLAINSLAMYTAPRVKLLGELRAAGVPMHQVHVFLGDSPASDDGAAWFDLVPLAKRCTFISSEASYSSSRSIV